MSVNRFVLNGISYHGHGAINEIPGIVKAHGFSKAFVASDPDLVKFGVTKRVTEKIKAETEAKLANQPVEINVERREHKPRPKKKG